MIVIGERINSTRKSVKPAVVDRDTGFIQDEAKKQAEAGASFIDVNAGALTEGEPEALCWLVETVQAAVDLPCSLDSPRPAAIEAALKVHKGTPLINSINLEKDRVEQLIPLAAEYKAKVIALAMDERIADTTQGRIECAMKLIDLLNEGGIPDADIFLDPCILGVGTWDGMTGDHPGVIALETMKAVREHSADIHICSGLSNVSFGLPVRKLVNRAAMILFMGAGMDSAICDPLDDGLMSLVMAAETVLNRDEFCANYIAAARAEKLVV
jgi:5-methyltetrahydrofolate--homocysteine methyltransferase